MALKNAEHMYVFFDAVFLMQFNKNRVGLSFKIFLFFYFLITKDGKQSY